MTAKKSVPKTRLLTALHASAKSLHRSGLIDARRMHEYDALCLQPVPAYSPSKIRAIRARHNLSQAVMAAALNASLSTVRQWEIGEKKPSGPAAKLLQVLDRKGLEALS